MKGLKKDWGCHSCGQVVPTAGADLLFLKASAAENSFRRVRWTIGGPAVRGCGRLACGGSSALLTFFRDRGYELWFPLWEQFESRGEQKQMCHANDVRCSVFAVPLATPRGCPNSWAFHPISLAQSAGYDSPDVSKAIQSKNFF